MIMNMEKVKKARNWLRKKKWRVLIVLVVWYFWFSWLKDKFFPEEVNYTFTSYDYTVERGTVSNSLSLVWTTQFANAQKLTFANKWRVTAVNTKVWDSVKKWDVLATITTDDLDKDVQNARTNLKNKQLSLNNLLDKSNKELDIIRAQSNYDLLVLKKENLPSDQYLEIQNKESKIDDIERQIRDKEKDIREAQNDYDDLVSWKEWATNAELALSKNVRNRNTTFEKLIRWFRDEAVKLQTTINSYDQLMKMTETYENDPENIYIWAKDLSLLNESKSKFWTINWYIEKLNTLYSDFNKREIGQITENELLDGYAIFKQLSTEMISWWKTNYNMFDESVESSDYLTRSDIEKYKTNFWTSLETQWYGYYDKYTEAVESLANIKDSDTTIEDAKDKVEKLNIELDQLKISLQQASNDLQVAKTQHVLDAAELDKKIQDAEVDLKKAKEWNAQQQEIDSIRNEIDNIQFQITTYLKKYDEYKIIANFDGIVTKLDMQVWDSIESNNSNSSDQKYIYVETPDLLEVQLSIDQVDIVKINVWMPVEVYVDAFPDSVYTWYFSEINTMPNSSNGYSDWTYSAVAYFQKNSKDENILWGMSASVKAILSQQKDAIVVPNASIIEKMDWEKVVLKKQENGSRKDQVVTVWLSDDDNTVIISWLNVWDVVKWVYITEEAMIAAWVMENSNNGFWMPGIWGPGMWWGNRSNRWNRGGMWWWMPRF